MAALSQRPNQVVGTDSDERWQVGTDKEYAELLHSGLPRDPFSCVAARLCLPGPVSLIFPRRLARETPIAISLWMSLMPLPGTLDNIAQLRVLRFPT